MAEKLKRISAHPAFQWIGWIGVWSIIAFWIAIGWYRANFDTMQEDIKTIKDDLGIVKIDVAVLKEKTRDGK